VSISAQSRSAAHATKSQLFTFPWGDPREAQTEHEGPIKAGLEHSAVEYNCSSTAIFHGE